MEEQGLRAYGAGFLDVIEHCPDFPREGLRGRELADGLNLTRKHCKLGPRGTGGPRGCACRSCGRVTSRHLEYMFSMRLRFILFVFAVYSPSLAFAQAVDAAGIKVKVDEALKAKQSSGEALAQNEAEEGRQFANLSAKLFGEARDDYEFIRAAESSNPALLIDYADLLSAMGDNDLA